VDLRTVLHAARRLTAGAVTLLALVLFMMPSPWLVRAQATDGTPSSLAGTAATVQVSLEPGAAARGELRFTYDGVGAPANAHATVLDHRIGPDGPVSQPPLENRPFSAASWITVTPASLELQPGATETVRYRVQVPADAAPGDYNAEVMVETEPPGPRSGVRLLVNVPGEPRHQTRLVSFAAQSEPMHFLGQDLAAHLPVHDGGPIQLQVQAENDGNFMTSIAGTVEMIDQFGRGVGRIELTPNQVLPGDVGAFSMTWPGPPPFGYFVARLRLEADGMPLEAETRLLVIPWQQVLAALLVVVALRLLFGERFTLPVPGRRRAAPPASAAQAPIVPAANGQVVSTGDDRGSPLVEPPARPQKVGVGLQHGTPAERDAAELLLWGQRAARAGDRPIAYRLFSRVLDVDPLNEEAWLWRGGTSDDPGETVRCLERVIELNPANDRARRGLAEVQRPAVEAR
jgi:hypothetical protein